MRILITGATGFVGGHLVERLRAEGGHELFGLSRQPAGTGDRVRLAGSAKLFAGELTDRAVLQSSLDESRPDWIFHLAGYANPGRSFLEVDSCWADNLTATRCLYEAVAESGRSPRILFISTGLVYGDPTGGDDVFTESSPLRPASPYATSKAAADLLSYQVTRSHKLDVVRVRPFNQIGPAQSASYAVANFARQVAAVERGVQPPVIETGDLTARRDLTDVRDMVAAYRLLIERGIRGEVYNAGCGTTHRIGDILERMITLSGTRVKVRTKSDPNRAGEVGVCRADTGRLRAETGWTPWIPLDRTLEDVLAYWRTVAAKTNT